MPFLAAFLCTPDRQEIQHKINKTAAPVMSCIRSEGNSGPHRSHCCMIPEKDTPDSPKEPEMLALDPKPAPEKEKEMSEIKLLLLHFQKNRHEKGEHHTSVNERSILQSCWQPAATVWMPPSPIPVQNLSPKMRSSLHLLRADRPTSVMFQQAESCSFCKCWSSLMAITSALPTSVQKVRSTSWRDVHATRLRTPGAANPLVLVSLMDRSRALVRLATVARHWSVTSTQADKSRCSTWW
jgi:hypothetical protein